LKVVLKRKDEEEFRNHPQESHRLIEGFGLP
jgi:hypothetical protein